MSPNPSASCVVIGNEILTGKVQDSNAHFLARWLRERGVNLCWMQVVPDSVTSIAEAVLQESRRADRVITSGGIGPTHDDVTYKGIAAAFGLETRSHPEVAARMAAHYGPRLTAVGLRMAELPHPCTLHPVDGLWVPVVQVRNVFILPGVPMLFQRMLLSLANHFLGTPVTLHSVFVLLREEDLAPALESILQQFPDVEIGSYPTLNRDADHRVRITLECRDGRMCQQALETLLERLDRQHVVRVERHQAPPLP